MGDWHIYTTMGKIDSEQEPEHNTGDSALGSVVTKMEGMGEEGGPRRRGYMYAIADSLHCTTL